MRHKWTDEDRRQLAEWHAERVPLAEMAERLGITQKAIEHQIYGKGVPRCANPRSITELTDDELRWLDAHYKNTKNAKIIARLRVSHSAVHRLAQTRGLYKTKQFVRKTQKAAVAAAYESQKKMALFHQKATRFRGAKNLDLRLAKATSTD